MSFDGFIPPTRTPANDGQRPALGAFADCGANALQRDPLLPMGPGLGHSGGIDGITSFQAGNGKDYELAMLEALRRSQAALQRKSGRFESATPEAQYLFAMTESLIAEDITRREASLSNVFQGNFLPKNDNSARLLI